MIRALLASTAGILAAGTAAAGGSRVRRNCQLRLDAAQ